MIVSQLRRPIGSSDLSVWPSLNAMDFSVFRVRGSVLVGA